MAVKGLSNEKISSPISSLSLKRNWYNSRIRVEFQASYLTFTPSNVVNLCIVYELAAQLREFKH